MEPVLFYGVPSGCSFGSIVALEWVGKPYRLARVDMAGDFMSGDYRFINPVGETPALLTAAGDVLTESMAILNHIGSGAIEAGLAFTQGTAAYDQLNRMLAFLNTSYFGAWAISRGCWGTPRRWRTPTSSASRDGPTITT